MQKRAIIFDFDGTIADSFDYVLEFLLKQAGRQHQVITAEQKTALRGLSMKDLALAVGVPHWKLILVYFRGKQFMTKRMRSTPLFTDVEGVLHDLKSQHYTLYIISSNSKRNIRRFLVEHGLGDTFARVYGNAGWFGKGGVLKKVLQSQKLPAESTAYVGDEVRDVVGAQNAGMLSVAVSWGFSSEEALLAHSPTVLIRKPKELQHFFSGLSNEV